MYRAIVLFLISYPFLLAAQAAGQGHETLRVRGVYIAKETPEQVDFTITIKHTAPDFKTCSDGLILMARDVTELLVRNGLDQQRVRISGLSVNEHYNYKHGERVREGFLGTAVIDVQAILSKEVTGMFFSSIHALEHDIEYSIRFSLSEHQKERLDKTSLEKAIEDARQKAEIMAVANNLELLRINRMSLGDDSPGVFRQAEYDLTREGKVFMDASGSGFPELSLNPREVSIYRSVDMEWIIRNK